MSLVVPVLGAGAGVGVLLLVAGARGLRPARGRRPATLSRVARQRLALGAACGLGAFVLTGWPVLALLATVGATAVPQMLSRPRRRAAAERSEAVAQWIEMLRDTMAGAAGLEEAIVVSARRPPQPIAGAVARLSARLDHHPLPHALRTFAADVDDPTADLLAAALIAAATNETRDLGRLLAALVETTRAQAQMRASIDAGRAQVRSATRLVTGVTALFTVALVVFSRAYLAPYATMEGQLWLGVVGGVFAASLVLLARLDRVDVPTTPLLAAAPDGAAHAPSGSRR